MAANLDIAIVAVTNNKEQNSVSTTAGPRRLSTPPRWIGAPLIVCAVLALCCSLLVATAAQAAPRKPAWTLTATSQPTNLVPGSSTVFEVPEYAIAVTNTGMAATNGEVTYKDTFPAGVTPTTAEGFGYNFEYNIPCDVTGQTVTCVSSDTVQPGQWVRIMIHMDVADSPSNGSAHLVVSGGGAGAVSASDTITVSSTPAPFGFLPGLAGLGTSFTGSDGTPVTQAGSHPDELTLYSAFPTVALPENVTAAGHLRDLQIRLPEGVIADPSATPVLCTESQLESYVDAGHGNQSGCPDASQVGIITINTFALGFKLFTSALYNMVPPPGTPAAFGFNILSLDGKYAHVVGGVDAAGNYALTADTHDILARALNPVIGVQTQLWGDPSDPSHDYTRGGCINSGVAYNITCPVPRTNKPFLTMPSDCSGPLSTTARADSWEEPGVVRSTSTETVDGNGNPLGVSGCSRLDFDPSITLRPDVTVADSSTGLHVDLKVPQSDGLSSLATSTLKNAVVTLPEGMSLSPSAADGLAACSSAQIGMGSNDKPSCPDASKIGTVEVDTPLLDDPLEGSVFVAAQNDNPSHSVLGIYVVAEGPGVVIKLGGHVQSDPVTGQLTTTFTDNPQLPFSDFKLDFFGGPRAALATPESCGSFTTTSALSPWSGNPAKTPSDSFQISSGCDGGFAPSFTAGVVSPVAGGSSAFTLQIARRDGQQHLRSVSTTLPQGLLARVGSVALCSDGDAAAGTCPEASRVGSTDTAAGPGSDPFHIAGKVFWTGPYKGGPYGLSVVVPAKAGPFDLGTVVVRASIRVDPITAQVTAVSDDIPHLLTVTGRDGQTEGFPLRVRSIDISMDRPGFMLSPTSCDPKSIGGTLDSWEGATANVSSRFQVGDCGSLALSPKLAIALTGKGQTTDDKHPGVHATVSQTPGQSNLKKVVVSLPLSLALDPDNAQALCEFTDGSKIDPSCPKGSIVGKATAHTPILDQPLTGPVYFVKNIRKDPKSGREIRTLPKLVIPLTGENGLRLNLVGTSNVVSNRLVSTFDNIPDAPVSDFTLDIDGGKSGILVVSGTDICKATQVAQQQVDGQNGKTADADVYLQTPACALKVLSKKVGKTSVAIKIGGLGAGKVTVTGKGIKKTTKTIASSTVATITAMRTHGKPGKVTVSFDPTGPAKAHKTTK